MLFKIKSALCFMVCAALLLCACQQKPAVPAPSSEVAVSSEAASSSEVAVSSEIAASSEIAPSSSEAPVSKPEADPTPVVDRTPELDEPDEEPDEDYQKADRTSREDLLEMMIDPPYDFNPDEMMPSDFGAFFTEQYPVTKTERKLLEGTDYQTTITVIEGAEPGPTVFVVAGVHGDEIAAWHTGNLLEKSTIKAGKLCVIAPANANGAKNNTRYVINKLDLNRIFPGNSYGNPAEKIADAILSEIKKADPVFLFDLHEARIIQSDRDYLGSSLIFTNLDGMEDLFFDLIFASEMGDICSEPFNYHAPGPKGSINHTVTTQLKIPTLTVETFRGYPLERRIADQLDIVQYTLKFYNML